MSVPMATINDAFRVADESGPYPLVGWTTLNDQEYLNLDDLIGQAAFLSTIDLGRRFEWEFVTTYLRSMKRGG